MPLDGIDQLGTDDAILLGVVGAPDIPDDVKLWGLLIPIRREFQQYVNLRPIRILPGVVSPLQASMTSTSSWSVRTSRRSTPRSADGCIAASRRRWRSRSLGEPAAAQILIEAMEAAMAEGTRTPDLRGAATTEAVAEAVTRHGTAILNSGLPSGWVL